MNGKNNVLLKELALKNVYLFGDKELVLDAPLTIITGRNGSGKTLLLDYIRLALGLKGRHSRFGRSGEFVFPGSTEARITVTLRNPISDVHGHRVISSSDPTFNSDFLDQEEIFIQRRVSVTGKWKVQLKNRHGKWVILSSEQQALLQEALTNAGLNPKDDLAFVDGEDFNMFISSNPHQRFMAFMTKLQLTEGLTRGTLIKEELQKCTEERDQLQARIIELNKALEALQEKEKRKKRIEELKAILNDLELHEQWRKVVDAENLLETLKKKQQKLIKERQDLSNEKHRLEKEYNEIKARRGQLERQSSQVEKKWQQLNAEYIRIQQRRNSLQQEIRTLKQRYNELKGQQHQLTKQKERKLMEQEHVRSGNLDERMRYQQKQLQDLRKQYDQTLQEIREIEETIKSLEDELDKIKAKETKLTEQKKQLEAEVLEKQRELSARGSTSSRGRPSYSPEILDFYKNIEHLIKEKRVYGPLAAVVSVQGLWKEDWTLAASLALRSILTTFVAVDKEAFREMETLRRSHPKYQDISLGLARKSQPTLMEPLSSTKFSVLVSPVLAILDGPPEVLAFIQGQGGAVILAHDADHIPTSEIDELLRSQNSVKVITQSGEEYSANKWSVLSRSIRKKKLGLNAPLLGTPLDSKDGSTASGQLSSSALGMLHKQIQKTTEALQATSQEREQFAKLLQSKKKTSRELLVKKGRLETEMKTLEQAMQRNDPSELMRQLKASIERINTQLAHVQGKMEEIQAQLKDKEEQLQQLVEKERSVKPKLEATTKEKETVHHQLQQDIETFSRLNSQLVEMNRRLTDIDRQLKELNDKIPMQENQVRRLQEELSQKGMSSRPRKIHTKSQIFERRLEATKELKFLSDPEIEKKDLSREIRDLQDSIKTLQGLLTERENDIQRLKEELAAWTEEWSKKARELLKSVNHLFNVILSAIGVRGVIEVMNVQVPEEGQLYIKVQFPGESERDIEAHSSGQKQITLVAFILALQVLSGSPLTAIDEVDKGLDVFHQATFFEKLPLLLKKAMELRQTLHASSYQPQVILVTPQFRPPQSFEDGEHIVLVTAKTMVP